MGQQNSTKNPQEEFQYISEKTGLDEEELNNIYEKF